MSDSVTMFSKASVGVDQFSQFLRTHGGALTDQKKIVEGRISDGAKHVWIFLNAAPFLEQFEDHEMNQIADRLGASPKTSFVLELSSDPGTQVLAAHVADLIVRQWPDTVIVTSQDGSIKMTSSIS